MRSPDASAKADADAHIALPWLELRANVGAAETRDGMHVKVRTRSGPECTKLEPTDLCSRVGPRATDVGSTLCERSYLAYMSRARPYLRIALIFAGHRGEGKKSREIRERT